MKNREVRNPARTFGYVAKVDRYITKVVHGMSGSKKCKDWLKPKPMKQNKKQCEEEEVRENEPFALLLTHW